MHSIVNENIMEHSEQVAQIAHALAMISNKIFGGEVNADRCVTLAVFHECSEVITGDLPTPIKYYNNEIKVAYKDLLEQAKRDAQNFVVKYAQLSEIGGVKIALQKFIAGILN